MFQRDVTFFGDVSPSGYRISHLLFDRRIVHVFVLSEEFILDVHLIREVRGCDRIAEYIERYQYLVDIWR